MIKIFTENDILKYVYKEVTLEEKQEFEQSLLFDNELMEAYQEMKSVLGDLNQVLLKPSKKLTDSILEFSKSFKLPP